MALIKKISTAWTSIFTSVTEIAALKMMLIDNTIIMAVVIAATAGAVFLGNHIPTVMGMWK